MTDDRLARKRAFEAAEARYRSTYERYFPLDVLGSRPALPMTPEAHLELTRLGAERDAARGAYEAILGRPAH